MTKKNDELAFLEKPTRQSWEAIILILFRLLGRIGKSIWPFLLIALLGNRKSSSGDYWIWIGLVAAGISAIGIEKGLLEKKKLNVPLDRVQTVNFTQNVIHQLFNVVQLEIDTAGSKKTEFTISALKKDQAEAIRDYLIKHRKAAPVVASPDKAAPIIAEPEIADQLLFKLSPKDLLKVGVSQNHFRTSGIILGAVGGIYWNLQEAFHDDLFDSFSQLTNLNMGWLKYVVLGIVFLFISFLVTLIMTVLKYFGLHVWRTSRGFRIVAGLFNRNDQSANINKIQLIRWFSNPIRRAFDMVTVRLQQAASTEVGKKQSMNIPGCYKNQLNIIQESYFPDFANTHFDTHKLSKLYIYRRTLYFGIVPALLACANLFLVTKSWFSLLILIWIPLIFLAARYAYRKWFLHINEEGMYTTKGVLGSEATMLLWYKVQAVRLKQTPYQRRKALANVELYTAAGAIKIPYLDLALAQSLQNYALYKVESDVRQWM